LIDVQLRQDKNREQTRGAHTMTEEKKAGLAKLKEEAKTFEEKTKKMFKSCKTAVLNVDDYSFYGVWGDFTSKKETKEVAIAWGRAFKRVPNIEVKGKCYRVSVDI
jgi:hypothetical protein